jgi:hypothetical protein
MRSNPIELNDRTNFANKLSSSDSLVRKTGVALCWGIYGNR